MHISVGANNAIYTRLDSFNLHKKAYRHCDCCSEIAGVYVSQMQTPCSLTTCIFPYTGCQRDHVSRHHLFNNKIIIYKFGLVNNWRVDFNKDVSLVALPVEPKVSYT